MALVKNTLKTELQKIFDQEFSGFTSFPSTLDEAADRWSSAFQTYISTITPPSTTISAAKTAMQSQLMTIVGGNGSVVFPQAIMAFATALVPGMLPVFTSTPPPIPITLDPVWAIGMGGGSSEQVATSLSDLIDTWFKTGLAVNTVTGVSIPWD